MDDRELLELAAKAAGIEGVYRENGYAMTCGINRHMDEELWNPLTDDGDALRLAVKLGINLNFFEHFVFAGKGGNMIPSAEEPIVSNADAATRRAIVRAAAEIRKGMK